MLWSLTLGVNCLALLITSLELGTMLSLPPTSGYVNEYWGRGKHYAVLPVASTVAGAVCLMLSAAYSAAILHCAGGLAAAVAVALVILILLVYYTRY